MGRYTSAYSNLRCGLNEVGSLRKIAAVKERSDPIGLRHEINAVCRGAIVLLSAHLESYIKELGEVVLDALHVQCVSRTHLNDALFYHISKDLLDEISETREPARIAKKVFDFVLSDLPLWSRTGPFPQPLPVERFNKGFSNPAFNKVRKYFNRFGYGDYKRDLKQRLKGDFSAAQNMVDHLVDTRNKIAHGDPNTTKTPKELADMISIIRRYGMATDAVFAAWCKKNICNIR